MIRKEFKHIIERYTSISTNHLTPEIKLRLIVRGSEVWNKPVQPDDPPHPLGEPFWAFYWPGGQGLSRYILDQPITVKGKRVLDFGCGSGAGAIAALFSGAKSTTANDIDHNALEAAEMNASLNNVEIQTDSRNLIGDDCSNYDVILVGDMLYDCGLSEMISDWLSHLRKRGKSILIGDPGRRDLSTRLKLIHLAKYELDSDTKQDNYGFNQSHVLTIV